MCVIYKKLQVDFEEKKKKILKNNNQFSLRLSKSREKILLNIGASYTNG